MLGLVTTAYVVMAATFGRDDALNPTAGTVYVLFWVGVPLLSVLLGPVWRLVNPLRGAALGPVAAAADRAGGRAGPLPAAARLLAGRAVAAGLRLARAGGAGEHLAARPCARSSPSTSRCTCSARPTTGRAGSAAPTASRCSPPWPAGSRRSGGAADGRLVLRDPLSGVAGHADRAGTVRGRRRAARHHRVRLVLRLALVGRAGAGEPLAPALARRRWRCSPSVSLRDRALFAGAAALSGRGAGLPAVPRGRGVRAHARADRHRATSLAHYWSLLVIIGQQTVIQLSDPLGNGSNWLGTGGRGIDSRLADPTFVAVLQVCSRRGRPRPRRRARPRPRDRAAAAAQRGARAAADAGG